MLGESAISKRPRSQDTCGECLLAHGAWPRTGVCPQLSLALAEVIMLFGLGKGAAGQSDSIREKKSLGNLGSLSPSNKFLVVFFFSSTFMILLSSFGF